MEEFEIGTIFNYEGALAKFADSIRLHPSLKRVKVNYDIPYVTVIDHQKWRKFLSAIVDSPSVTELQITGADGVGSNENKEFFERAMALKRAALNKALVTIPESGVRSLKSPKAFFKGDAFVGLIRD